MTAFNILVILLTIAAIAAVLSLARLRKQSQGADEHGLGAAGAQTLLRDDTEVRATARPRDTFDAVGTMIYRRATHAPTAAAVATRGDAAAADQVKGRLVGLSGSHKGSSFPITAAGIKIGRSPYSDIVVRDRRVSYCHAWIGVVDDKVVLRDLKSTNGTFLNAHASSRVGVAALRPGDTVFIGGHQGDQFRIVAD